MADVGTRPAAAPHKSQRMMDAIKAEFTSACLAVSSSMLVGAHREISDRDRQRHRQRLVVCGCVACASPSLRPLCMLAVCISPPARCSALCSAWLCSHGVTTRGHQPWPTLRVDTIARDQRTADSTHSRLLPRAVACRVAAPLRPPAVRHGGFLQHPPQADAVHPILAHRLRVRVGEQVSNANHGPQRADHPTAAAAAAAASQPVHREPHSTRSTMHHAHSSDYSLSIVVCVCLPPR